MNRINLACLFVVIVLLHGCGTAGAAFVRGAAEAYNNRNTGGSYSSTSQSNAAYKAEMRRLERERQRQEAEMRQMQQQICDQAMRAYNACLMRQRGGDHSQLCLYPVREC